MKTFWLIVVILVFAELSLLGEKWMDWRISQNREREMKSKETHRIALTYFQKWGQGK